MMIATSIIDYSTLITECYKTDPELIEKWHVNKSGSLKECIEQETEYLYNNRVSVFSLYNDNTKELIGYFGEQFINNTNYLTGFFIKPKYRNKKTIKEFWNIVNLLFERKVFYSGIDKNNTPAYNFLMRNNGLVAWEDNNNSVFIMMNWEK